jgi:DNA polymerase I
VPISASSRRRASTARGLNTSAAFGFTLTLLDLIKREKPTHIAVVFDTAAPTDRHIEHTEYKANRQEMPDDIRSNVPYIRRIIEAFNIPCWRAMATRPTT